MARKPGRMYREIRGQITTRKEYLKGVPNPKITQFDMGNRRESFPVKISLLAEEACNIRHNALDAARVAANRYMEKSVGVSNYHLKVRVYPHVILRENKQATGAGADRVSQGMRKAYGKPVGTAARVKPNQPVISIETKPQFIEKAKEALRRAGMKIPSPFRIVVET
ncbi:MAG TPA: 50S ribosomal protein L16 [Thermoplasmatales archaeon]|nr:MAG: 50S ribosomal protein L16 [Thermoplasmata archaeon]KAA0018015.1 MAG: 50S ribosomal protein L16 [Thermoplasmata archaeon]MCD6542148.1 50S ribosomal protein L16 [Thermoplasmata archaeon]HHF59029.1 50S ribosomal protein L16 [Thermoplasmatales archaeon]